MKVNQTQLNNVQVNFLKELMGDQFMPDARAEAVLNKTCAKYKIKTEKLAEFIQTVTGAETQESK